MLPNPATQGGGKDTKLKRQQTFLKLVTFRLHFLPFNGRTLAPQISLLMGQTPSEMTRSRKVCHLLSDNHLSLKRCLSFKMTANLLQSFHSLKTKEILDPPYFYAHWEFLVSNMLQILTTFLSCFFGTLKVFIH